MVAQKGGKEKGERSGGKVGVFFGQAGQLELRFGKVPLRSGSGELELEQQLNLCFVCLVRSSRRQRQTSELCAEETKFARAQS